MQHGTIIKRAISGTYNGLPAQGDYLELSNQWAKVFITREIEDRNANLRIPFRAGKSEYVVTGDLANLDESICRETERRFPTAAAALENALMCLRAYAEGRSD